MNKSGILNTTSPHVRGWRAAALSLGGCVDAACLLRTALLASALIAGSVAALHAQEDQEEPEDPATRNLNEGYEAKESGDLAGAVDAFRRAMEADPSNLDATLELGHTLLELKREEEAIPVFEHAVELAPERADLWAQLGYLYEGEERKEKAADAFRRAMDADPGNLEYTLALGYTLVDLERNREAIPVFEHALGLAPERGDVWAQLGYLYVEEDRKEDALEAFLEVERLNPEKYDDRMQLAYLLDELGHEWEARKRFAHVAYAPAVDPELREQAKEALQNYADLGIVAMGTRSVEMYGEPYYTARFKNFILPGWVRGSLTVAPRIGLDLYTVARVTMDTRTEGGGELPQILSDNMIGGGLGVRVRPLGPWATLYGEVGFAAPLRSRPDPLPEGDYRAGVVLADVWTFRGRPGDVFADASWYNRYRNSILYGTAIQLFNIPREDRKRGWDYYGRLNLSADTDNEFFNNILEVGPGIRYLTGLPLNLTVFAEALGGLYTRGNPDGSDTYGDLRIGLLLYGKHFWLARDEYY